MRLKRVVVTGLGAVTPVGNNVADMWQSLLQGVSAVRPVSHFDASHHKTRFACEVSNFDSDAYFDRKLTRRLDLYSQYALVAARECMADAGLTEFADEERWRIGAIIASGIGGIQTLESEVGQYYRQDDLTPKFPPYFIPKLLGNIAAGLVSLEFGLKGPNFSMSAACASSAHAIGTACDIIRLGRADVMIAGGAESAITAASMGGFGMMRALSTRNDSPETASRAFSKSRDGFVMGEGAGCLVLEELEHAKARGARIYAELTGYAATADAYHLTASHPEGEGAAMVMKGAIRDAGIETAQVDYINAHGTSTPLGDISEVKAITSVFGEYAPKINISSTKTMMGHLLGAAGAVEAIISILTIRDGLIPPTINHSADDCDPDIHPSLNFTFNHTQKRNVDVALTNSFGFGGHNATLIFQRYKE